MALHVIFIDDQAEQLSDVISNFTSVQIPSNAFVMRIADSEKSYSNSTLTKLFEIDNTFYSKVLEYTTKGDYPYIDISVSDFGGFTAIFNQLSAQFVGNNPPEDIFDFSGYGAGSGGNIDFSTIVAALESIATALSALTNLSNLSNLTQLANIISAIQNKDNQSDIVDCLNFIFTETYQDIRYSAFKPDSNILANISPAGNRNRYNFLAIISRIMSLLTSNKRVISDYFSSSNTNNFRTINQSLFETSSKSSFQNLQDISVKLQDIETKLEQNLPFTTIVNNDYIDNCVSASVAYNKKIENIPFN